MEQQERKGDGWEYLDNVVKPTELSKDYISATDFTRTALLKQDAYRDKEVAALKDALAQRAESEMPDNEYHIRVAWDATCQERDDLKNQVKALSAIKTGLEKSLSDAFEKIESAAYWKARCEAAEFLISEIENETMVNPFSRVYQNWQQLKNQQK